LFEEMYESEVDGSKPRGRQKRPWTEVVQKDCQACRLNRENDIDRSKTRKMIKDG